MAVHSGPLPVFKTKIPYSSITAVKAARSSILDGWGIHWLPGRGVIYNVWGFDCVRITVGKKTVRIGTDDVDGLTEYLRARIQS